MITSTDHIIPDELLEADAIVVGSGAAGIPLALELAEANLSVILLEAGSEHLNRRDQSFYAGTVSNPSLHPPADRYRQRRLGGTTPIWGGRCVPFDAIDFDFREYIPLSGWPISPKDLDKYLPLANEWLEAGRCSYKASDAFSDTVPPLIRNFDSDLISIDSLERFSRPTDVFTRYRGRVETYPNLQLIYGANCTWISLGESGNTVSRLTVSTIDLKTFYVRGKYYVLAVGGIETARLLLASNDVCTTGVGNEHDVVGRYYMCHIAGTVGTVRFSLPRKDIRHGYDVSPEGIYCRRRISLFEAEQRKRKINNVVLRLHFPRIADPSHKSGVLSLLYLLRRFISYEYAARLRDADGDTIASLLLHLRNVFLTPFETAKFLLNWIRKRTLASRKFPSVILENKTNIFSLEVHAEQSPNFHSRIYLSERKDEMGVPRVIIDWQYTFQEIRSVGETLTVFGEELARLGIGTLRVDDELLEKDLLRFGAYGGHHIGTARMGLDPTISVVDSNCKVHNLDNLYIAGSAVFPTSSQANPTLMITTLAVRLAHHLVDDFSKKTE